MNYALLTAGYPWVTIRSDERFPYFQALERAQTDGDVIPWHSQLPPETSSRENDEDHYSVVTQQLAHAGSQLLSRLILFLRPDRRVAPERCVQPHAGAVGGGVGRVELRLMRS